MDTSAPAINKIAISPPEQTPDPNKRKRIQAAVDFGALLEEAFGRSRELSTPSTTQPREGSNTSSNHPPDLLIVYSPEELLQSNLRRLKVLEQVVLRSTDTPYPTLFPLKSDPQSDEQETDLDQTIQALQEGNSTVEPEVLYKLSKKIIAWDERITHKIVNLDSTDGSTDSTDLINGYMIGKALSWTRWKIGPANQTDGDWQEKWKNSFEEQRIHAIQQRLNASSDLLDPQAATVVATSLGYWRHALADEPPPPIKVSSEKANKELLEALDKQLANWLDLLTGRRPLESFTVTGIVSTLTRNITTGLANRLWWLLLGIAILFGVVLIGALALLVIFVIARSSGVSAPAKVGGIVGGAGTTVATAYAFLAARGRSLFNRGTAEVDRLRQRMGELEDRLRSQLPGIERVSTEVTTTLGLPEVSWHDLKDEVLSNVVKQIRLEEFNLAVSEPLMDWVFSRKSTPGKSNDRLEDAKTFMKLVYGEDKSNLHLLQNIFQDLCKNHQTPSSGGV